MPINLESNVTDDAVHAELLQLKKDLEKAQQEKQDIKDYYENMIALLPGHVYWLDRNQILLGCNDLQAKHLGLASRQDIVGKRLEDLVPDWVDLIRIKTKNTQVMDEKKLTLFEEKGVCLKKEATFVSHKAPLKDATGKVIGLMGISLDISYQKALETELKQAKEEAEKANRLKTEFVKNMQHDIRTPLYGVLSVAKFLLETETDTTKKQCLTEITQATARLLEYCTRILELSCIEECKDNVLAVEFDIRDVVSSIIEMQAAIVRSKKLQLKTDYDPELPALIRGDNERLQKILINLVSNAIKFTQEGSITMGVKVIQQEEKQIKLNVFVKDTGMGIPEAKRQEIFEKFVKGGFSEDALYTGYGLGLSMVKEQIARLQGEITVESEVGKGTQFNCLLSFGIV